MKTIKTENKPTHTPGPWTVKMTRKVEVWASSLKLATVEYSEGHEGIDIATARLIAAAPDLLSSLSAILANETPADAVWKKASSAVAKAGGPFIADLNEDGIASKAQALLNFLDGVTVEGKGGSFMAYEVAREELRAAIAKAEGK